MSTLFKSYCVNKNNIIFEIGGVSMKLHPTKFGEYKLGKFQKKSTSNVKSAPTTLLDHTFGRSSTLLAMNRTIYTTTSTGAVRKSKTNVGSPFKAKSWQNKLWRRYFKSNSYAVEPYETADKRTIEGAVIRYFVIRQLFDDNTGELVSRDKVLNECVFCGSFYELVDRIKSLLYDMDRLNDIISQDCHVATYTTTFRALVRYSDGSYDSTPTMFQDVLDILGLKVECNDGQYDINLNPHVVWVPMQNVVRGEYT